MSTRRGSRQKKLELTRRNLLTRAGVGAAAAGALVAGVPATALALRGRPAATNNINLVMSQEPPTLGYRLGNAYVATVVKVALGSQPQLTRRNDLNDWVPYLATSTPRIENGGAAFAGDGADQRLQVSFDMRQDVKWSDGVPVTGHDVAFAWQLIMNPDYPVADRTFESKIAGIEVTNDYHVTVNFMSENEARDAASNGRLGLPAKSFADFASQSGPVVDPAYYKGYEAFPRHVLQPILDQVGAAGLATHDINRKPLGIGPFKLAEWAAGQFIALQAIPNYFLGAPRAQAITVKIISDTNAVLAALATGDADVVTEDALTEFNGPDLDRMEQQRTIKAYYTPSATWEHIDFNLDNPHLKDVRVRQAIAYAVNRQLIVDRVLNGKTKVIHTWAPAWAWWYNPSVTQYEFSPSKAKDLLSQAGYAPGSDGIMQKNGLKLSVRYQTTAANKTRELVTQIVQQNLKDAGIEAKLSYMPAGEFFAAGDNPGPLYTRDFDMAEFAWVSGDDPAGTQNLYHTSSIPSKANGYVGSNDAGYSDPRNDQLLHDAENTLDQAARQQMYSDEEKLFSDAVPVLPLYARANVTAISRGLQNFRPTPTNTPPTWNAYDWFIEA